MKYYGKYRGTVTDNKDPKKMARIKAQVPAISSADMWCLPCVPYAGKFVGLFFIPPIGANVWIEFETGDPDYPIWSGCFWATTDTPSGGVDPNIKMIKTDWGTITIDDTPMSGKVAIETITGLKLLMDAGGIEIANSSAKIKLDPIRVVVNDGALEVL